MSSVDICNKAALRKIIRELEQIARECELKQEGGGQGGDRADTLAAVERGSAIAALYSDAQLVEHARRIYRTRRKRDKRIGLQFFGEPSWDILLDLFIHHNAPNPVSVTDACIGSAAPQSTALRWLGLMEREGLIERYEKPDDRRVALLRLTAKGMRLMREVLGKYLGTCFSGGSAKA